MRSLRLQMIGLLLASLGVLAVSFILILGKHMEERAIHAAIIKADTDLAACTEIIDLKYPGDWRVENGKLYKGDYLINNQNHIVDALAEITGDTVTIFLNDTRVATTVRNSYGERAIGTKVSDVVAEKVLKHGERYLGEANVVGQMYQTDYEPIRDAEGKIIGMLYVGISRDYTEELIVKSLRKMAAIAIGLTIGVSLLAWYFLEVVIFRPLRKITLGTRDLATGHSTDRVQISGPKEIGELASAFNQVIERLDNLTKEMEQRIPHRYEEYPGRQPGSKSDELHGENGVDAVIGKNEEAEKMSTGERLAENANTEKGHSEKEPAEKVFKDIHSIAEWELPKGLHKETLIQIMEYINEQTKAFSSEDVAEGVKLTRVTVRRYLEFLEQAGELSSELKYGTVGRPVRIWTRNM